MVCPKEAKMPKNPSFYQKCPRDGFLGSPWKTDIPWFRHDIGHDETIMIAWPAWPKTDKSEKSVKNAIFEHFWTQK